MSDMDVNNAVVGTSSSSGYTNTLQTTDFYKGSSKSSDSPGLQETRWTTDWAKWHGSYNDVPVFAAVIDTLALWAVGKGFEGKDKEKLMKIKGRGNDDGNTIIENLCRVFLTAGDSFAEQIRDKAGRLTNLKPLNPGRVTTISNASGILKNYELEGVATPLTPKEMFHLSWERLADEVHGKPLAERAAPIINQIKQLQEDLGLRFHRITKPIRLFEASTDNPTKLANTETKLKFGYQKAEIIVIPKGTLAEAPGNPTPSAQDTLLYLDHLTRNFVTSCNVPEIILGWGLGATEATSKIIYLAFQQRIERIQKYLEDQIKLQLGLEVEFNFPADLMEAQAAGVNPSSPASMTKDGNKEAVQPKDVKS